MKLGLVRYLLHQRAARRRLQVALASHGGEIIDRDGLRVQLAQLAAGLARHQRHTEAAALLAAPDRHLARAVRRIALASFTSDVGVTLARAHVPGLIAIVCARCGRSYAGTELWMHVDDREFRVTNEGRCPEGHPLPALPAETSYR